MGVADDTLFDRENVEERAPGRHHSRAVSYAFSGKDNAIAPREIITHTACLPGTIAFATGAKPGVAARYEAADGQLYTLKSTASGMAVEVGGKR